MSRGDDSLNPKNISVITEFMPSGLKEGQTVTGSHISLLMFLFFAADHEMWFVALLS
jgi:hypothetical protein